VRNGDDKKFSEIAASIMGSDQLRNKMTEISIQKIWPTLMGKTIAGYTAKISFSKGNLSIYIQSASLKNELSMGKEKIQNLINQKLGSELIKKVIIL
jgi:hypothetical protein